MNATLPAASFFLLLLTPHVVGIASAQEVCDIVPAYCAADGLYYEICCSDANGDCAQCWENCMEAIRMANMSYQGDESSGCETRTCLDEPCPSGNPTCPYQEVDSEGRIVTLDRNPEPWKVAFYVVCCDGRVVGGGGYGNSYCEAYREAKEVAIRVATRICGGAHCFRCCYSKVLKRPCIPDCQPTCPPKKRCRLFRR